MRACVRACVRVRVRHRRCCKTMMESLYYYDIMAALIQDRITKYKKVSFSIQYSKAFGLKARFALALSRLVCCLAVETKRRKQLDGVVKENNKNDHNHVDDQARRHQRERERERERERWLVDGCTSMRVMRCPSRSSNVDRQSMAIGLSTIRVGIVVAIALFLGNLLCFYNYRNQILQWT
jgi:hypothetical protein